MPFVSGGQARIRTNTPAENAYNALESANRNISLRQLRLSTGKRINNASDDVAGYITSRALQARNISLKAASKAVGNALNTSGIIQDALDNINGLLIQIKDAAATASSGAMGTDEKVALAKAAYRLTEQVQTVVNSTVFGGEQLLDGNFETNFYIGYNSTNDLLSLAIDMRTSNVDFNVESQDFNLNSLSTNIFGGVTGLNLASLNDISATDLGMFSDSQITTTLTSLADAINNTNKVAAYVGGISNRLTSQQELLSGQIVNYNAAISRLEDADVAQEQLDLIKSQFLQQASLISLSQANQNPNSYLQLLQG